MTTPVPSSEAHQLDQLATQFMAALDAKDRGKLAQAETELLAILAVEPRLPEPRMELGYLLLTADRLEEAETHLREALDHLRASGPWTDAIPPDQVLATAHTLLGEALRRRADRDEVVFGDGAVFQALITESRNHFARAATLDPAYDYPSHQSQLLGQRRAPQSGSE